MTWGWPVWAIHGSLILGFQLVSPMGSSSSRPETRDKVNLKIHSPFPWAPVLCRVTVGWLCLLSEATAPAQWPSPHSVFLGLSNCILYSLLEIYVWKWFHVVTNPDTLHCALLFLYIPLLYSSQMPQFGYSFFFLFWWCLRKYRQYGWQCCNWLELTSSNVVSFLYCRC